MRFLFAMLLVCSVFVTNQALADSYNHCVLYDTSKCPGANATTKAIKNTERSAATPSWSAQAGKGMAQFAVDLDNICRWIDNAPGNATTDVFVPFKTDAEWLDFYSAVNAGSGPAQYVAFTHCARPSTVSIPPNDPAGNDISRLCYDENGVLQTAGQPYVGTVYGRAGEHRLVTLTGISFQCYTDKGAAPGYSRWTKTATSAQLLGYSADRPGGSSFVPTNSDWGLLGVAYNGAPPAVVNGVCGSTVNNQNLSSAPSGSELCNTGTASAVNGDSSSATPWTWTCQGSEGGTDASCEASNTPPSCPVMTLNGNTDFLSGTSYSTPSVTIDYPGASTMVVLTPSATNNGQFNNAYASYFNGLCTETVSANGSTVTFSVYGKAETEDSYDVGLGSLHGVQGTAYADFISCLATEYARANLPGYSSCTASSWGGNVYSPLKMNLSNGDAKLNSTTPTAFNLPLKDGRTLEGHVTGGLNADEGWLMVHRSADPLVLDGGVLNANDWFGDRDHRSLNGYTDLAETFASFLEKDENGQRFIPLHQLSKDEKKAKLATAVERADFTMTDPSFDLRVIDANYAEHFASDYFDRIYVDYRSVVDGDSPDGRGGNNIILERGMVHTISGENHGAVDQWFVLDLPADYHDPGHPTQSKVWPAGSVPH